ncbi:hypothetical protein H7F51_11930 [Novosphingobium flavum]|uniref:Lipocalin-like domain-containing protein n=1 Tax=Novosphingobium flavum TaxID=1778672 RepID=A0A7X1FTL1_9SPHN|nr:hypothetical protein [Novosphingobium flavum]MBC2666227.1 hypothetical protein [Novosphingobium flavum]
MFSLPTRIALASLAMAPLALALPARAAESAPQKADLSAFLGRWTIDPARTKMGRNGPNGDNILRATTFTFEFLQGRKAITMNVYAAWPQTAPTRTMPLIADGKAYPCPGPNPCLTAGGTVADQTYSWHQVDNHALARLFYVKGKLFDISTLSVAADGQTMTLISWDPATPEYQNIQVFGKQP